MSDSEEEFYSIIFVALKHPIRRKILRMLHERSRSFSEVLGELKIESSHLTYHIETLGDLLHKTQDGKYALSFLGEAAISMMYRVEETPRSTPRFSMPSLKWAPLFSLLMTVILVFAVFSYVNYQELNQLRSEYERTTETLSSALLSAYYRDIQAAIERWIEVHGYPFENGEVKPSYINTGDVAAWIDPKGYLKLVTMAGDFPSVYGPLYPLGGYWNVFPYAHWVRPPEVIAVWVQLYNRSSGLWFPETEVFSRKIGEFAFYFINSSSHEVVGIDGNYAALLLKDFKDNSLPNILPDIIGTSNYVLSPDGWGMSSDGSWTGRYEVMLKYDEPTGGDCIRDWCPAYNLELLVDWKTETVSIETLTPK